MPPPEDRSRDSHAAPVADRGYGQRDEVRGGNEIGSDKGRLEFQRLCRGAEQAYCHASRANRDRPGCQLAGRAGIAWVAALAVGRGWIVAAYSSFFGSMGV
jgi:hypothetical protein